MKKKKISIVLFAALATVLAVAVARYNLTSTELVGTLDNQVVAIFESNDCMVCHSPDGVKPFYAVGPVEVEIEKDMTSGLRFINLKSVTDQIKAGESVSEIDLIKIKQSLVNSSMPLDKYKMIHWGSNLNGEETRTLSKWINESRQKNYTNSLAAAEFSEEPIRPLRDKIEVDQAKAELGFDLFHDVRISENNTISCATCHELTTGGVDGLKTSKGIHDQIGGINAPTVYNAALNHVQFWDGRSKDLQEQAGGPPLDMLEMGSNWEQITGKLKADKELKAEFKSIYGAEGITQNSITDAIAEFEKTLLTPNSKFDKYQKGDLAAISAEELEGYDLFKSNNCASCHGGENVGGIGYDYMGVTQDYFADRGIELHAKDMGRIGVTNLEVDKHKFKTPSLRNIALTAPYFHDGTINDLAEAVIKMDKYQSGNEMSVEDADKIVLFLNTLTGENSYMQKN